MNKHLQTFARNFIKERLKQLPAEQQLIFNRMYSHLKLDRTVDEAVDAMPAEKLSWAMEQVETSYNKGVADGTVPAVREESTPPGHTWRCSDCFGPLGEEHSENCGVARGLITLEHCGDSPIPNPGASTPSGHSPL